jgi:small multidrug resistance family-3 protein
MTVGRSILLFIVAGLFEIGGCWLIWQGIREHRGAWWIVGGIVTLGAYGLVVTFQPSSDFGRILAAYGGVFIAASLAWGAIVDGYRPDRWDIIGALICLGGVSMIMYGPRT